MKYTDIISVLRSTIADLYPDRELESIARLIAEHSTGLSWAQIHMNRDTELTDSQCTYIGLIIKRLGNHEPIQYVLGETEFYGFKLKVRPGVLIPRGETEELVEWVLKGTGAQGHAGIRVMDIGCGSGAIAIALAQGIPDATVYAADISEDALLLTRENAVANHQQLHTLKLDLLNPSSFPSAFCLLPFALIVSNPPYIPLNEKQSMASHVADQEPDLALFVPDEDPLIFYRAIAEFAKYNLTADGSVYVEIHDRLGAETMDLFRNDFSDVELRQDIHGKDRMIRASNG